MATKKAATKKPAATPAKSTKTAVKAAVAKKTVAPKNTKTAAKAAPAKKVAAKAAPAKKVAAPKKAAPVPAKKVAVPAKKVAEAPKKAVPAPAAKKAAPVKTAPKAAPKVAEKSMPAPVKKAVETVKEPEAIKPVPEVKSTVKAPVKAAPAKKEPPKPIVIPKTSTTRSVKYEPDFTKSVLDIRNQTQEHTGPTMRYSDAELAEFRELINRKLDTAKKELAYLQGLITRKDESGDIEDGRYMTMEDGSMSMEREQLSQMASRQIQFIDHLEKAIMRIENKTYGVCRVTGKLIDKARLRAVPHATLSIEAKQMMNK
ncbi:MAG TPA: TraR/DksA C4-type zinc finger protein [Flavisolibacter sp.]|nr:TraR/DksA C4-type zinc finger protein [Flavisolibacter sp.]